MNTTHYKKILLTTLFTTFFSAQQAHAAESTVDPVAFTKRISGIANAVQPGMEPAYDKEGLGSGNMWGKWTPAFEGTLSHDSDLVKAVIALRQPGTRNKTDFSRDIFAHMAIVILNQRGNADVSLGMLSDTSNMGRHVRSVQRALEWNNTDMQTVMEALGYTGLVHIKDGIDFEGERSGGHTIAASVQGAVHKAGGDVKKVVENVGKKIGKWFGGK